jgi:hypothetical protein
MILAAEMDLAMVLGPDEEQVSFASTVGLFCLYLYLLFILGPDEEQV